MRAMATVYRTRQREMIDAICARAYGDESGYVERVLEANPGLATLPDPLPINTIFLLPDVPVTTRVVSVVKLWD